MTDITEVERVAAALTEAQREALLAIKPGEQRRATDFSGSVATRLCRSNRSRPALLMGTLTCSGRVAWYEHLPAGLAVRTRLIDERTECQACGAGLPVDDAHTDSDGFTGCRPCFPVSNRPEDADRFRSGPCLRTHLLERNPS